MKEAKRKLGAIFFLVILLLTCIPFTSFINNVSATGENWWNTAWLYRELITIDRTKITPNSVVNFPVMINFTDSDLSKAQSDGDDITFILYSDNSTQLHHEIEHYSNSNGALLSWVNVTRLSSSVNTKLWIYYGNPSCASQQDIHGTWRGEYKAVYHLDETTTPYVDSTINHNNITSVNKNGTGMAQSGGLYKWQHFNGTTNRFDVPMTMTGAFTFEAIANPDSLATSKILFSYEKSGSPATGFGLGVSSGSNAVFVGNTNAKKALTPTSSYVTTGVTHWWSEVMRTTSSFFFYLDGSNKTGSFSNIDYFVTTAGYRMIGARYQASSYSLFWDGYIDEVRFSNGSWNASWMTATYNTEYSPGTFFSVGVEERTTATIPYISNPSPTNSSTNINRLCKTNITVNTGGDGDSLTVTFFYNTTAAPTTWVNYGHNNSVGNGTYRQSESWVDTEYKTYWWKCTCNDGTTNVSSIFHFTTKMDIVLTNPQPINGTTDEIMRPVLNITINNLEGKTMTVTWFYYQTGTWVNYGSNATVGNGTYHSNASFARANGTEYQWKVSINDATVNISYSYYFYTKVNTTASMVFVSKTGSDSNTGTKTSPLLTIGHAISHAVNPGDIIYVRQGNYNQMLYMNHSGTTGDPITLQGYPGETAVVDGIGLSIPTAYALIMIGTSGGVGKTNITIKDISIKNSTQGGIRSYQHPAISPSNIIIDGCYFSDIDKWAVWMGTDLVSSYGVAVNIRISNCTFWKIGDAAPVFTGEGNTFVGVKNGVFENNTVLWSATMSCAFSGGSTHCRANNNILHVNESYSAPNAKGFYCEPSGNNNNTVSWISIYRNIIWGDVIAYSSAIKLDTEQANGRLNNITIYDNIINLTSSTGFTANGILVGNQATTGRQENITIKFNTIYIPQGSTAASPIYMGNNLIIRNWVVANNILVASGSLLYEFKTTNIASTDTNLIRANNLYYHTGRASSTSFSDGVGKFEVTAVRADPEFYSLISSDFRLNRTSPAINAGNSTYPVSYDYVGIPRPVYSGYDIGAFEYTGGTPIITNVYPQDGQIGLGVLTKCRLGVIDAEGDTLDVRWYEHTTGNWVLRNTNSTVPNGTYRWTFTQFDILDQTYYWSVNVTDGVNYINISYVFYTGEVIHIHGEIPFDSSLNIVSSASKTVNATVTCRNGKKALVYVWYYDSSDVYHSNTPAYVINTSVSWTINASASEYMYTWGVSATNETNVTNQTFSFTTMYLGPYYVNGTSGDDSNDGSIIHPFKTLIRAFNSTAIMLSDGILYIETGTYYVSGGTYFAKSLIAILGGRVTIKSYSGETIRIITS